MKIVAISGSRRHGNSFAMVEAACRALKGRCSLTRVDLGNVDCRPCDGCLRCDKTGACRLKDDMQKILPKIAEADGFIIATPARWSLLSGELKVFLDRLNPLAMRELLKGKKAIIFAAGQSSKAQGESVRLARDSVAFFCDNAGIDVVDSVLAYGLLLPSDIKKTPAVLKKCEKASVKLLQSLAARQP